MTKTSMMMMTTSMKNSMGVGEVRFSPNCQEDAQMQKRRGNGEVQSTNGTTAVFVAA